MLMLEPSQSLRFAEKAISAGRVIGRGSVTVEQFHSNPPIEQ